MHIDVRRLSLKNQLNIVILLLVSLSFFASIWVNVNNARGFLSSQLAVHAQDTATSLGLSLREPMLEEDEYAIHATINAIFDAGFFESMRLESVDGRVRYERKLNAAPQDVPVWFVRFFPLKAPMASTHIDTGWTIGGVLYVQPHPGLAYRQLWQGAVTSAHLTLTLFAFALALGYILLRQIYKPIQAASEQARHIGNKQFELINPVPKSKELHTFVSAMNRMVLSVKSMLDGLSELAQKAQQDAYLDTTSKLANRAAFEGRLKSLLELDAAESGYLLMLRFEGLQELNKKEGYLAGDELVQKAAAALLKVFQGLEGVELYRISGSEFVCCMPENIYGTIDDLCSELVGQLKHAGFFNEAPARGIRFGLGLNSFAAGDERKQLLYGLDLAARRALDEASHIAYRSELGLGEGFSALKQVVDGILATPSQCISLRTQPLHWYGAHTVIEAELFAAFEFGGLTYPAADIFAAATHFGLVSELDVAVLGCVLEYLSGQPDSGSKVVVGLCKETLFNPSLMPSIIKRLKQSAVTQRLVFGVSEQALLWVSEKESEALLVLEQLKGLGVSICVNRFGSSLRSLTYLMALKPLMVRLDPAFTASEELLKQNKPLLLSFLSLAHGLGVKVGAQYVESQAQFNLLSELGLDASQGYYHARPKAI
ncbi:LapD/MoxY N-terminal periplasmic domain-containing protein [Agaribacterium sp. ZY112]|uniref:bifunctional diguanylate cyclase/phosphodiesterase n=1 Tax=Agaribacterium sp. ZY112 TaxID=3233574 RepID=UPI00352556D6